MIANANPTVVGIQTGALRPLDTPSGTVSSGIFKEPVDGFIRASRLGLAGDCQGDTVNHGGSDKAICVYPVEHLEWWSSRIGAPLAPGAFGENLTVASMLEDAVCIGDTYSIGTTVVQISQPRQPCYRLAARHGVRGMAADIQRSGRTGFYLRVLRPGRIAAGLPVALIERTWPLLTIAESNRVVHQARNDVDAAARLVVPELSERWRRRLDAHLARKPADDEAKRLRGAR